MFQWDELGRTFIQDQNIGVLDESACNSDALLLTARELGSSRTDGRFESLGETADEMLAVGLLGGSDDLRSSSAGLAVRYIFGNRSGK